LEKSKQYSHFVPQKKYSAVALEHPDNPETVTIYIKGAAEIILGMSKYIH